MTTSLIRTIAPYFVPYLELLALTGEAYYFRKASTALRDPSGTRRVWHPRIKHTMLRSYHSSSEGILYAAFPASAKLHELKPNDLLYIGCSATGGSRFWRGRPAESIRFSESKSCFHHEQMRRGRDGSNLEHYLANHGPVRLHTLTSGRILEISAAHRIVLPAGRYPAHQLELKILSEGFTNWMWNARC